ncbi:MAG: hypothetical protein OHK0050_43770 [Roseiflexaceae bacterium]
MLFERAQQKQAPLTLACLDIDHFKQINDSVFHTGGDQVLRSFAEVLQQHIRETDSIARIGGEEFALLLPHTDLQQAIQLCERLRQRIANHDWQTIAPNLKVTVSIGLAEAGSYQSAQELLHHADTRLYIAKRLGRNQVVAAE